MSKERLEEILELHEKAVVAYEDCDFLEMRKHIETLFLEEFTDWLIEQVKRVQELEDEVDKLKVWYGAYHRETKATERLREKNKRYREALERQFGEFWEACVKVVGEDMAYDIVAEMSEEGEE